MDDKVWNHSVFSKNRDRLLDGEIARKFLEQVVALARDRELLSDEHFTVDGTLIEAWAGHKRFKAKDAPTSTSQKDGPSNPSVDFHGHQRKNATHQSTSDPEARLMKKGSGKEAKLSFMGHVTNWSKRIFGWLKTIRLMRTTRHKGTRRGGWMFSFTNASYNLIRIRHLANDTG